MTPRKFPALVGALAGGGIATPAVFMLVKGMGSGNILMVVLSGIILISVLGLAILFSRAEREKIRVSPYRRENEKSSQPGDATSDAWP